MGIDKDKETQIYFSVNAHFMLVENRKGELTVLIHGKDGVSLKRVIEN